MRTSPLVAPRPCADNQKHLDCCLQAAEQFGECDCMCRMCRNSVVPSPKRRYARLLESLENMLETSRELRRHPHAFVTSPR